MSNDKVQSIMALVTKYSELCGNGVTAQNVMDADKVWREIESAIREAIAAPGVAVAHLWQHGETGRTRVVMPDMVFTADENWHLVGPLYLAPPAPGVAQGMLAVPIEPTPAMLCALWEHRDRMVGQSENKIARAGYSALLAAAPSPIAEQRPPYCGSGHCSCIECPYGSIKGGPAK